MRIYSMIVTVVVLTLLSSAAEAQTTDTSGVKIKNKEKAKKIVKALKHETEDSVIIAKLNEALALNPYYAEAFILRGKMYMNTLYQDKRRLDHAILDFCKALDVTDSLWEAHFERGNAYRHLQLYSLAQRSYAKALLYNPDNDAVREAIESIADSTDMVPDSSDIY